MKSLLPRTKSVLIVAVLSCGSASIHCNVLADEKAPHSRAPVSTGEEAELPSAAFVSHAAGTVLLEVPPEWYAGEITQGRSLRLVLSPEPLPQRIGELRRGVWIAVRYRSQPFRRQAIADQLTVLRQEFPESRAVAPLAMFSGDGQNTYRQDFATADGIIGFHQIVQLPHACVQFCAIARNEGETDFIERVRRLVDAATLADPKPVVPELGDQLADAADIVGAWKSMRGEVQWRSDGRVTVRADEARNYALDEQGRLDYSRTVRTLSGTFSARDDLVEITWDDGSRLNYRWRLVNGELLLTDHLGRVSRLWRLLK